MINREQLVKRHNPKLTAINTESPLTVGNGELCFTADITGMQSLYKQYADAHFPLCTMSQWGWHSIPVSEKQDAFALNDLEMTEYLYSGRKVYYAVEEKQGNEEVYTWLRKNPHRLNFAKIALLYKGKELQSENVSCISQELELYEGILYSHFAVNGNSCEVKTLCDSEEDRLIFFVNSDLIKNKELLIEIEFPYGSHNISGSDWEAKEKHQTTIVKQNKNQVVLKRVLDNDVYYVNVLGNNHYDLTKLNNHKIWIMGTEETIVLQVVFSKQEREEQFLDAAVERTKQSWIHFWGNGGIVRLNRSKDHRAVELERRIILSQYLLAIQSAGSIPPQETGLTCNSWYGKFHLEMHLWHSAWMPLWKKDKLLKRSISWYQQHLQAAKENAGRNAFCGAKWPKMIAEDGYDSPSQIATLLIWQQPHVIYMLELLYQNDLSDEFLRTYWEIIRETAIYMADFVVYNEADGKYHLVPPLIPAQEEHDPLITIDPVFELEYWKFGLDIAISWAKKLGELLYVKQWTKISVNLAESATKEELYLAHANCPDTFAKFQKDHPSMLGSYGLIYTGRLNAEYMKKTLKKVLACWKFETMWGWDFAMMAMTAVRLGQFELAVDILLMDTDKNKYVVSGNNYQYLRSDLPLYLPGNGSLLLAVAMMCAGYGDHEKNGFPKDGSWTIEFEDIVPFPY
ncbi:MAG: hypothetical protein ACRC3H_24905 [Lachnospiraceae bacterium]